MIVTKTPLRMSFTGGGSDISSFYLRHEGVVISTTIDKYIYISINKKFDKGIRISYSLTETPDNINEIKHPLVRNALKLVNIKDSIEIASMADIPSQGSGLGSSSSYTVGLINALYAFQSKKINKEELARTASHIEIDLCKNYMGKQDQYAAAYGGLNIIKFKKDSSVTVEPIKLKAHILKEFTDSLLMCYTGKTRKANQILKTVSHNINDLNKFNLVKKIVNLSWDMKNSLESGNLENIGEILNENWYLKKQIAEGVTSNIVDDMYSRAIKAGALGGKLLGAGGGGFMLFYANKESHNKIIAELKEFRFVPFHFDEDGAKIILYNN